MPLFQKLQESTLRKISPCSSCGSNAYQPRYRMEFWLEGLDHDVETGPHLVTSKERYMFFIVSENDLLAEIAREEEKHKLGLEQAKGHLLESESRLGLSSLDLSVLKKLLQAIDEVLAAMGTLTDINKLVAMLRTIEEERKQFDLVQKIHEELVRKTLEYAINPCK
ncbi:MAG: hypothetical protein EBT92_11375 [Planctomycetes bacterium]|nr:hypothetical protein [Planctomycetota bacterium]